MLFTERVIKHLRTGDNSIRYAVALVNCSTQNVLYSIDVVTQIDYSDDPKIKIFAFDNPKAAVQFVKENIDADFTFPVAEKMIAEAPEYFSLFPESSIIAGGKADFPSNWTYPSPIGIKGGSSFSEHGKGFLTYTAKNSYSGQRCQGYITVVVTVPADDVSFPSTGPTHTYDDVTHTVYKCNDCGYIGMDFEESNSAHVCPKCGSNYKCATCDYEGVTATCPHCNTISPVKTPNTSSCYSVSDLIAINVQFEADA